MKKMKIQFKDLFYDNVVILECGLSKSQIEFSHCEERYFFFNYGNPLSFIFTIRGLEVLEGRYNNMFMRR